MPMWKGSGGSGNLGLNFGKEDIIENIILGAYHIQIVEKTLRLKNIAQG